VVILPSLLLLVKRKCFLFIAQLTSLIQQLQPKLDFVNTQIQQQQQQGGLDNHTELEKLMNEKDDLMKRERDAITQKNTVQTDLQAKAAAVSGCSQNLVWAVTVE
jgi:predicted Holliday junction resolvase-like endonuclease